MSLRLNPLTDLTLRAKISQVTQRWVRIKPVTWAELIRKLKAAGFVEQRTGKGSHRQFIHPGTKKVITVSVHTKKDVGKGLERRILKDAGLDEG